MRAAIFPGQGIQGPGFAQGLEDLQPSVFAEASDALGIDMCELCREGRTGPADLSSTRWAQPAIVTASVAAALTLAERGTVVHAVAGHSLGEYSALVAAGSLSVGDGVRLVASRAEAMDRAAATSPGVMAAILGLHREAVDLLCEQSGVVVAGDNAPGQIVVSGPHAAIDRVMEAAKSLKGKVTKLNVAGAFHSPAMASAVSDLRSAVDDAHVVTPKVPFWSATTATRLVDPSAIRDMLVDQLTKPVLWLQTVRALLASGVQTFRDVGPGNVVANLVKRIAPEALTESGV